MSTVSIKTTISKLLPHFLKSGLIAALFNSVAHGLQTLIDNTEKIYSGTAEWACRTSSPYSGIYYELSHNGQKNSMQAYLNAYMYGITNQNSHLIWVKDNVDNVSPLYIFDDASSAQFPETYARYVYDDSHAGDDRMYVWASSDYVNVTEGFSFIVSVPYGMPASDIAALKNKVDSLKVAGVNYNIIEREA